MCIHNLLYLWWNWTLLHLPLFTWPRVSWGVATCSEEIFGYHIVESPHPQIITCCLRFPWQEVRLYCTWWRGPAATSETGLPQLSAKQICFFHHWFCIQMSTEHGAWDLLFPETLQMQWLIQTRRSVELTREGRVEQWEIGDERADSLVHSSPPPTLPRCGWSVWFARTRPQLCFELGDIILPHDFCSPCSLPHFLVSLTLWPWLHSSPD